MPISCLEDQTSSQGLKLPGSHLCFAFTYPDGLLEHDSKIISFIHLFLKSVCVLSIHYLGGIVSHATMIEGIQNFLSASHHGQTPQKARTAVLSKTGMLGKWGPLCPLLGEPDTGLVMEGRTSSTCPEATVRCRFVGQLTV